MATHIVIEQPQSVPGILNPQEWGTGLFDCFQDIPKCCLAFWCLPCFACMTSRDFGEHLCLPLLDIFGGWVPPITLAMRLALRHRYGIQGSIPVDCVLSTFCFSCVWCQMSREINLRSSQTVMITTKNV